MQVRFLQEAARVHKSELEWQAMKQAHAAEQEAALLRRRHTDFERDLQRSMDDLTCGPTGSTLSRGGCQNKLCQLAR